MEYRKTYCGKLISNDRVAVINLRFERNFTDSQIDYENALNQFYTTKNILSTEENNSETFDFDLDEVNLTDVERNQLIKWGYLNLVDRDCLKIL